MNASRMVEKERQGRLFSPTIASPTWDDYGLPARHRQQDEASPEEEEASVMNTARPQALSDGDVSMAESALDVTMAKAKLTPAGPNQTAGARYEANPEAAEAWRMMETRNRPRQTGTRPKEVGKMVTSTPAARANHHSKEENDKLNAEVEELLQEMMKTPEPTELELPGLTPGRHTMELEEHSRLEGMDVSKMEQQEQARVARAPGRAPPRARTAPEYNPFEDPESGLCEKPAEEEASESSDM